MAEALNNVDTNKEVNQTPEQKTEQAIQDIKKESGQEDINKLFEKNFLDNLLQETALKLLNIINSLGMKDSELPKDLKNLKDVLEPKAAKIQSFGEKNNFISDSAEDLARKERKLIKTITKEIEKLSPQINDSNTKGILNQINNIVNNLNGQNKAQLTDFLERNGITNIDRTDNTSILNGVTEFLNKIDKLITDKKESDAVLQEREANKTKFTEFFNEIIKPKQRNKLDKYNYRDYLDPICTFIQQSPRDTNVIEAYLQMKQININNQNNVHWSDKEGFKTFFGTLENLYGKDKPYNEEAAQQFWGQKFDQRSKNYTIIDIATKGIGLQNWDGKNLNLNDPTQKTQIEKLVNNMGGASFDTKYFVDKFNKINQERIAKNKEALSKVNFIGLIPEDVMNNLSLDGDGENEKLINKLLIDNKQNGNGELKADMFLKNIGIENELKSCAHFLGNEFDEAISDTQLQNEWFNKLKGEIRKNSATTPTEASEQAAEEQELEAISEIKTHLFSGLNTGNVIKAFNEAIKKEELTDEQKQLLNLARKGLTSEWKDEQQNESFNAIQELQQKLGFTGSAVDGRFGIKTFNALKKWCGVVDIQVNDKVVSKPNKKKDSESNNSDGSRNGVDNGEESEGSTNGLDNGGESDSVQTGVEEEVTEFNIGNKIYTNYGSYYNLESLCKNDNEIDQGLYLLYIKQLNEYLFKNARDFRIQTNLGTGTYYTGSNPNARIQYGKKETGGGVTKGQFSILINLHDFQNPDGSLDNKKIVDQLKKVKEQDDRDTGIEKSKYNLLSSINEFSLDDLGLGGKRSELKYQALMTYFEDGKIKIDKKWTLPTRNANGDLIFDLDPKGRGNCPDYFRGITISRKDLVDNETGKYDLDKFKSAFGEKIIGIVNDNIL